MGTVYKEDKSIYHKMDFYLVRIVNFFANVSIWVSFFVFYYYVYQASKIIGHFPVYGDPEFFHLGMNDKYEIIDFYSGISGYGFLISTFIITINQVLKLYKVKKVSLILGYMGLLLFFTHFFTPQFDWYID